MLSTLDAGKIWQILAVAAVVNLPFIILNYHYTSKNDSCTKDQMLVPPMPLATWMLVDAIVRAVMLVALAIIAAVTKFRYTDGQRMFHHYLKLVLVFVIFEVIWMILGAISLFTTLKSCSQGLFIYLIIMIAATLIFVGYVGYTVNRQKIF